MVDIHHRCRVLEVPRCGVVRLFILMVVEMPRCNVVEVQKYWTTPDQSRARQALQAGDDSRG